VSGEEDEREGGEIKKITETVTGGKKRGGDLRSE